MLMLSRKSNKKNLDWKFHNTTAADLS